MSVGKASIKRAASAGTKKTAEKATEKAAAPKAAKKTRTAKAEETVVQTSVLTPMDAEEIQVKFLSKEPLAEEANRPVRVMDPMPTYLL